MTLSRKLSKNGCSIILRIVWPLNWPARRPPWQGRCSTNGAWLIHWRILNCGWIRERRRPTWATGIKIAPIQILEKLGDQVASQLKDGGAVPLVGELPGRPWISEATSTAITR